MPVFAPKIFEHEQFGQCRFVMIKGEPWFVAVDLYRALEIKQPARALSRLDDDEKGVTTIHTLGGPQQVLIVSELGLYRLIFTSRKAEARQFQRWVCHEVLPSIRKYGYYVAPHQRIIEIKGEENLKRFKALERGDNVPNRPAVFVYRKLFVLILDLPYRVFSAGVSLRPFLLIPLSLLVMTVMTAL